MTILEKELGIQNYHLSMNNEKIKINGEAGEYKELQSCDHIITPTKKYIICNIANLLQQSIETDSPSIDRAINQIRCKDKELTELIEILHASDLVGPGKAYQVHNGKIRYSFGTRECIETDDEGRKPIRPSANFITSDANHFQPINNKFSRDIGHFYYQYYCIGGDGVPRPNETFQPLGESNYGEDGIHVYHTRNLVAGAKIKDGKYEIIKNDQMEILIDSLHQMYAGHKKLPIKNPEQCKHMVDNFLFDGASVYLIVGDVSYDLTEIYKLTPGENISKLSDGKYKIGKKEFTYDGLMDIKFL